MNYELTCSLESSSCRPISFLILLIDSLHQVNQLPDFANQSCLRANFSRVTNNFGRSWQPNCMQTSPTFHTFVEPVKMSCPVFKTCLVYLSLCSISHGALIQTKFQRISNGNRTTDTVIRTVQRESQLLCGEACLADQECRGYHWSHEPDALLQHKCELLKYVHLPNIL